MVNKKYKKITLVPNAATKIKMSPIPIGHEIGKAGEVIAKYRIIPEARPNAAETTPPVWIIAFTSDPTTSTIRISRIKGTTSKAKPKKIAPINCDFAFLLVSIASSPTEPANANKYPE